MIVEAGQYLMVPVKLSTAHVLQRQTCSHATETNQHAHITMTHSTAVANGQAQVTMEAGKYLVEQFVVHGLVAAVALPMTVMSAANLIDTWWTVCLDRAEKAGKLLAHVLMSGAHGDR